MKNHEVIIRPVITEAVWDLIETENKMVFEVAKNANKQIVKRSVQELYNVKVRRVRTMITPAGIKRAICELEEGYLASDLATELNLFG